MVSYAVSLGSPKGYGTGNVDDYKQTFGFTFDTKQTKNKSQNIIQSELFFENGGVSYSPTRTSGIYESCTKCD